MKARENPFASAHLERLSYRFPGFRWEALISRLQSMQWRASIVGPEGAGKTTLLEQLEGRLQVKGHPTILLRMRREPIFARLYQVMEVRRRIPAGALVLLDGAEQIPRLAWPWFARSTRESKGLIITTHVPLYLPVALTCRTSPELLGELIAELTESTEPAVTDAEDVSRLHARHQGNLRAALRELYDQRAAANREV